MNNCWPTHLCFKRQNAHLTVGHAGIAIFEGLEVVQASMGNRHGDMSWIEIAFIYSAHIPQRLPEKEPIH